MRFLSIAAALLLGISAASCSGSQAVPAACGQPGQWRLPDTTQARTAEARDVLERMARQQVVLLGEAHDSAEDHRWQLHTLTQLYTRQAAHGDRLRDVPAPRAASTRRSGWLARLSEEEFLQRSEWEKVWGFDARDYLPLFHFARMNRIPMLALNVERSLIEAVGKRGWDGVPEAQKEGVGKPVAPSETYRKQLRAVFDHHPAKERGETAFPYFVEGQTTWDRAMAQVMAEHLQKAPESLVVGILGAGHVRHGHGVAHQLKALGVSQVGLLLTWDRGASCSELGADYADALYLVDAPKSNPPRLGVATEQEKEGLRITQVMAGSVAESAGFKNGDVIIEVAGQPAKSILTLRSAIQRQSPGTWLPLKIRRDGKEMEIVARFPVGP